MVNKDGNGGERRGKSEDGRGVRYIRVHGRKEGRWSGGSRSAGLGAFTERAVTTRTGSVADARPFLAV